MTPSAGKTLSETVQARALAILRELDQAQIDLLGKAVVLTDGKAGAVDRVVLDDLHGLRISVRGHDGDWPISTLKFTEDR